MVEACCDGVVYVVQCCACRVVASETMLCGDMLDIVCDAWEYPISPMCLRCLMFTLSGPVELLFLLCFIAHWTCVVVSVIQSMCLFVLCV